MNRSSPYLVKAFAALMFLITDQLKTDDAELPGQRRRSIFAANTRDRAANRIAGNRGLGVVTLGKTEFPDAVLADIAAGQSFQPREHQSAIDDGIAAHLA